MVHKERASLWKIKHLLTRLSGDNTWMPCENVETDNDFALFSDEQDKQRDDRLERLAIKDEGDHLSIGTMASEDPGQLAVAYSSAKGTVDSLAVNVAPVASLAENDAAMDNDLTKISAPVKLQGGTETPSKELAQKNDVDGSMEVDETLSNNLLEGSTKRPSIEGIESLGVEGLDGQEDIPAPRRMRTRAQAQAATDTATSRTRSMTPDSSFELSIHPYFLAPKSSHADRDLGLPPLEAEETRRLLQLYIQKQEEVCRGAQRVYEGLLRAERYRHLVMKWAKAEAHVGVNRNMSDGEDWYDLEEWGLDEDLKKGENEEDEDPQTVAKKTRTRRQ